MARITTSALLMLAVLAAGAQAEAQGRQNRPNRQEIARAQGVPPGQLPPAGMCRVWYDNRPPGRQPAATGCDAAEAMAARDRNARVIYGDGLGGAGYGRTNRDRDSRHPATWDPDDRAVARDGRVRDPRVQRDGRDVQRDGRDGRDRDARTARYTTPGFQSGYRDGLEKGREDAEDRDAYDPNRHGWYKSATRGYENEYGPKSSYQALYREGFDAGYAEGYRAFARR